MNKILPVTILMLVFTFNACSPLVTVTSTEDTVNEPIISLATETSAAESSPQAPVKLYTNNDFGIGFLFPVEWFGPQEYISEQTLRVEVGSDVVYPYGEPPETPSDVRNSYSVIVQYSKGNQNSSRNDTWQSLLTLQDGESISGQRGMLIRIRALEVGRFTGFEYIATLSETAQTEWFYSREVILVDKQTNDLLTILGQPVNVEVGEGVDWRDVFSALDEQYLPTFNLILGSLSIQ